MLLSQHVCCHNMCCCPVQAILETELASTSSQNQHLQQQLEAVERNRTDLEASWLRNRRLNHAARIIQRRYRLWRSRNHVAKFGRDAEVSSQLKDSMLLSLCCIPSLLHTNTSSG